MSPEDVDGTYLGGFLAWIMRAVLLWVVFPIASLVWPFVARRLRARGATFWQYVGWADLNLIAFLTNGILRPLYRRPLPWQPVSAIPTTTHRVRYLDFG